MDPHPLPLQASASQFLAAALKQIDLLIHPETANSPFATDSCAACQAALGFVKMVSLAHPEDGPAAVVALCEAVGMTNCPTEFGPLGLGNVITQVLANANTAGYDGQVS